MVTERFKLLQAKRWEEALCRSRWATSIAMECKTWSSQIGATTIMTPNSNITFTLLTQQEARSWWGEETERSSPRQVFHLESVLGPLRWATSMTTEYRTWPWPMESFPTTSRCT